MWKWGCKGCVGWGYAERIEGHRWGLWVGLLLTILDAPFSYRIKDDIFVLDIFDGTIMDEHPIF